MADFRHKVHIAQARVKLKRNGDWGRPDSALTAALIQKYELSRVKGDG
jgi:hypothetical protein